MQRRRRPPNYLKWITGFLKRVPPVAFYATLQLEAPSRWPVYWFVCVGVTAVAYAAAAIVKRRDLYRIFALFSAGLLVAGFMELTGLRWPHMAYIPLVILTTTFFSAKVMRFVVFSVPFLEVQHLLAGGTLDLTHVYEELSLFGILTATAALTIMAKRRVASRSREEQDAEVTFDGLENEPVAEIRDVMKSIMYTVRPDTANLFLFSEGELSLKCSSEPTMRLLGEGLVHEAVSLRHPIIAERMRKERFGPGYVGLGKVASMVAMPVMDGSIVVGVLSVDSELEHAFTDLKVRALSLFAGQIAKILERKRIQDRTEMDHLGTKVLYEESLRLISSIELEDLAEITMDAVQRIAPMDVAFLLRADDGYEFISGRGIELPAGKPHGLKNTLAGLAIDERQPNYISDLRLYKLPVLPTVKEGMMSTIILPLFYKDEVLGSVVLLSQKLDPLTSRQIEHLKVIANQSAMSVQNSILHAEIKRMAVTDGLTGLYNHRHFQERLRREIGRFQRTERPFSLLLIDIDFFKRINDTYGHPAGDEVLRGVAGIIRKTIRDIDIPARYGGEEFAALLIDTGQRGASRLAERVRKNVENARFKADGDTIKITASIGIASCSDDGRTAEELIDRADKALYLAKESGRNRVVLADKEFTGDIKIP